MGINYLGWGVYIYRDLLGCAKQNLTPLLNGIKNQLVYGQKFKLSWFGRLAAIKPTKAINSTKYIVSSSKRNGTYPLCVEQFTGYN